MCGKIGHKMNSPDWPIYFKDQLILGNVTSPIGIVTLWTPKENVAEYLKPDDFSVCGQLYTKGGIEYIFRNILANPCICHLIMCGVDRQGSGEALKSFFEGTEGDICGDIPHQYLNLIRKNVALYDMRTSTLEEVSSFVKEISRKEVKKLKMSPDPKSNCHRFCEPVFLIKSRAELTKEFPTDRSVFKIRRDYIGQAWLDALKIVGRFGSEIPGMYGNARKVENLSIIIEKEDPDVPKIFPYFKFDQEQLNFYYKGFFSKNDDKSESYTYGERIFNLNGLDQEKIIVEKLQRFEFDRGAVIVLWDPQNDNFPPKGEAVQELGQTRGWRVPCLAMILGQVSYGKFDMTAIFRNNDVYGAWPLNALALRKFQKNVAQKIGKDLGVLTTIAHIAEIYDLNLDDSVKIVGDNSSFDNICQQDSRSYYIVKTLGEDIEVAFYSPDGSIELCKYRKNGKLPKAARDLSLEILSDYLIEDLGAACDLGRQLAKAEVAIKLGLKFVQDQPLNF